MYVQPQLNNRKVIQPRGKVLGGSSAINFMMLTYPSRGSIDSWAALGNDGWDYDSLKPYFRKTATVHAPPQCAKNVVGRIYNDDESITAEEGPIHISWSEGYGMTNAAWMEAFSNLGLSAESDIRVSDAIGAFQQPATIDPKTRTRSYAATAHYGPDTAARPNLVVLTGTYVKKIIFDTTNGTPIVSGVLALTKDGLEETFYAGEVILAAGALMSPQILELSGIGSRKLLESLDIRLVVDNPAVGENLQDHPMACQSFEVNDGVPSSDVLRDPEILKALVGQYQATAEGPMGQSNLSVANAPLSDQTGVLSVEAKKAFFAAHEQHMTTPDVDVLRALVESPNEPTIEYILFPGQSNTVLAEPTSMADYMDSSKTENYLGVLTLLHHPFSRGSVHITSPDVTVLPSWDPKLSDNPLDLEVTARHVLFVERLISTEPLSSLFKKGGARIPDIVVGDDLEKAKEVVRQSQVTDFHPAGSCAMLPREKGGVVDTRLRVYGVKGLRIVDASIFPLEPVGHLQSVVYAVAEKAAQIIKDDHGAKA